MHVIVEAVALGVLTIVFQWFLSWMVKHDEARSLEVLPVTFTAAVLLHVSLAVLGARSTRKAVRVF